MRKQSKAFQSKRSGARGMPALAHHVVNDKSWQLAASYGLMNLLRRVGMYWLPRNTNSQSAGESHCASRRFVEGLHSGAHGEGAGLYTPQVINNYIRSGIHSEAA